MPALSDHMPRVHGILPNWHGTSSPQHIHDPAPHMTSYVLSSRDGRLTWKGSRIALSSSVCNFLVSRVYWK